MIKHIPILMYHSISNHSKSKFTPYCVSPETLTRQMGYLKENGYVPLTVSDFMKARDTRDEDVLRHAVVITFDDGFIDFYFEALPILKRYGFPATLYIATGYVGKTSLWLNPEGEAHRKMLTWEQIAELLENNIEIGAHSITHPQLDIIPIDAAREEIKGSKAALEKHLNREISTFAYPHGYYSIAVRKIVQEAGFSSACAVRYTLSPINDDRFILARLSVENDTDMCTLLQRAKGPARLKEEVAIRLWRGVRYTRELWRSNFGGENGV